MPRSTNLFIRSLVSYGLMLWRLIDSDLRDPAYTAAADEAMLLARHENIVPDTIHLYRRDRPTVSLGYFERVEEAVDLAVAQSRGVQLVRRVSGGSAIFTDPGQIIYCVIVDRGAVPESPNETFALVCSGLVNALARLGLKAEFKPVNDVLVNKRKISGSAQTRKLDVVLQHGTLMVDTDFDLMFEVLRTKKKERSKDSVTSLSRELGSAPPLTEVKEAMVEGFASVFGAEVVKGVLTHYEERKIEELVAEKYAQPKYTLMR
jgi:lipoate---protein ligase